MMADKQTPEQPENTVNVKAGTSIVTPDQANAIGKHMDVGAVAVSDNTAFVYFKPDMQGSRPANKAEVELLAEEFSVGKAQAHKSNRTSNEYVVAFKPAGLSNEELTEAQQRLEAGYKIILEKKAQSVENAMTNGTSTDMAAELAEAKQDPRVLTDTRQIGNKQPLIHIAAASDKAWTKALLTIEPDEFTRPNKQGRLPIHTAAMEGDLETLKYLSEVVVSRNEAAKNVLAAIDKHGRLAIHNAAESGNIEKVKLLAEKYPEGLQAQDANGKTPLHYAALDGHTDIAAYLLSRNPELLTVTDKAGNLAMHDAVRQGHMDIVAQHLNADPSLVDAKNQSGQTVQDMVQDGETIALNGKPVDAKAQMAIMSQLQEKNAQTAQKEALTNTLNTIGASAAALPGALRDGILTTFNGAAEAATQDAAANATDPAKAAAEAVDTKAPDAAKADSTKDAGAETGEAGEAADTPITDAPAPTADTPTMEAPKKKNFLAELMTSGMGMGLVGGIAALLLTGAGGPMSFLIAGAAALGVGWFGPDLYKKATGTSDITLDATTAKAADAGGIATQSPELAKKYAKDHQFDLKNVDADGNKSVTPKEMQEFLNKGAKGIGAEGEAAISFNEEQAKQVLASIDAAREKSTMKDGALDISKEKDTIIGIRPSDTPTTAAAEGHGAAAR